MTKRTATNHILIVIHIRLHIENGILVQIRIDGNLSTSLCGPLNRLRGWNQALAKYYEEHFSPQRFSNTFDVYARASTVAFLRGPIGPKPTKTRKKSIARIKYFQIKTIGPHIISNSASVAAFV